MSGATSPTSWTYAEYARLPSDGKRYEVLDGSVLVTPSPGTSHQRIAFRVARILDNYVREHSIGEVLWDLDLLFVDGQFLRPDIQFVSTAERTRLTDPGMEGAPDLVVEVVSPSSRRIDSVLKPARYAEFGVREYWAVDPRQSGILVWNFASGADAPSHETERLLWQPAVGIPALEVDVSELFETK